MIIYKMFNKGIPNGDKDDSINKIKVEKQSPFRNETLVSQKFSMTFNQQEKKILTERKYSDSLNVN